MQVFEYVGMFPIELKTEWLFWTYFGIMGVSSIIARWYSTSDNKSRFVQMVKHTAYICTLTLLLLYFAIKYLTPTS